MQNPEKLPEETRSFPWKPAFIVSIFTIGLIALISIYYHTQKTRIFTEQEDNLSSIAILKLRQIEQWYQERIGDATEIRDNQPLINFIDQSLDRNEQLRSPELLKWMASIRNQSDYSDILVVDTSLSIKISMYHPEVNRKYDRNEMSTVLIEKTIHLTDLKHSPHNDSVYMDLMIPLLRNGGENPTLFGIMILRIDPSKTLFPLVKLWPTSSKSSETLLFRKEGDSVLYLNELRHKSNTALNLRLPRSNKSLLAAQSLEGKLGFIEGIDYRGIAAFGYSASVSHLNWFMVTKTDKAELLAPVYRTSVYSFFIALLILIINTILFLNWNKTQKIIAINKKLANDVAINELEEKFYVAFHRSPVSVGISMQSTNQFIDVNDTFIRDMEYTCNEIIGKTAQELNFWFDDSERVWVINEIAEKGHVNGKVLRFRSKSGKLIYGLTSISVINVKGEPCNLITVVNITDTKKSEQQLLESETLFSNLFENMLNGFAYCKMIHEENQPLDFIYINVNKAFTTLTGLKDVKGKRVSEVIPGIQETDQDLLQRYLRVSATGRPETFETYVESMRMWFLISLYSPEKDYFVAVFDGITERKNAETSLRESEDKFKYVFDYSVVGKSITQVTGEIHVNKAFCDMTGYSAEELTTIKWQDISHPDDIEMTQKAVDSLLNGKMDSVRFNKRYIKKDGSTLWVDVSTTLRHDKNGNPLYFMTSVNDITERINAEEILRNDEKRLRDLIEALPQLFWTCRADGPCDYLSQQWIEYTGIPESEQLGYGWFEQLHPDDKRNTIDEWNEKIRIGDSFDMQFRIRRKDGEYHWFQTRAVPMRSNEDKILKWLGSTTDIESILKAEAQLMDYNKNLEQSVIQRTEQLESANKELEAFSYSVSHDLRAPLRAVHGFTKILQEDYDKILDDEGRRICGVISSSANQMSELIDDLLSFSRIGRSTMSPSVLNMEELASTSARGLVSLEDRKDFKVTIKKLNPVPGDPSLIKHVWNNLISNAIKYSSTQTSPEILITSRKDGDFLTYVVKDNGVGFDMQYSNKLFGVFQRLHSESEFEGNGVGLAIVQRIINRHGGKTWAESELGKGATFYFSLPDGGSEE